MSYLDIAAASTAEREGASFLVGGLRPSLVVRQTSLSHEGGDRIEGAAFAQFAALAETTGAETLGKTLRATSLDAISRSLLQLGSQEQRGLVAARLAEAVRATEDSSSVGKESSSLEGVAATVIQWPHVAVATRGLVAVAVVGKSSVRVVGGCLNAADDNHAGNRVTNEWHGELSPGDLLVVGNAAFARRWSPASLSDHLADRRQSSAQTLADELVAAMAKASNAASVIVAKIVDGPAPTEASVTAKEENGGERVVTDSKSDQLDAMAPSAGVATA